MKKLKINLLAIIGMMVAVATLAFTAPKETALADNWYHVTDEGTLTSMDDPAPGCDLPSGQECAIQLNQSVPENTPRDEVDESDIIDRAFKTP